MDLKKDFEKYVLSENTDAQKISVTSIELVYYDNGKGIIEPALRAKAETEYATDKAKQKTMKFPYDIVVPLLKTPQAIYSYMHDKFKNGIDKKATDDSLNQRPMEKGVDERK
ncbi:MAG: hypothetical protein HYR77_02005 [Ignavibacteria bacterium]|nr:hypothetical protein [Ignavibacteria bacterium]